MISFLEYQLTIKLMLSYYITEYISDNLNNEYEYKSYNIIAGRN